MQTAVQISIHALRVEGDHLPLSFLHTVLYFYPRPPGWRATTVGRIACAFEQFLSTPSGWRATSSRVLCSQVHFFSIHALRVEGDPPGAAGGSASKRGFLSTPSGWRATCRTEAEWWRRSYFYPRPPGGGRRRAVSHGRRCWVISIHALRVEGDVSKDIQPRLLLHFYPRPPGGGRHYAQRVRLLPESYFYPRPPGGGRQQKRTKFSSVFAQKGEEFASLRRGKRKICRWRFKKDKFWVLIWCEGSGKSVCALASHCG